MAPDTKVPAGRPDRQRQNNIPPPMAGDNKVMKCPYRKPFNDKTAPTPVFAWKTDRLMALHVASRVLTMKTSLLLMAIFKFGQYIIGANIITQFHKDWGINVNVDDVPQKKRDRKRGTPGLVMGPCIVEIDRIVIRDVQHKFEVIQCRNEEVH
ncbi:hypothetical protein DPMN_151397, partial [Dreissena polymorpha]